MRFISKTRAGKYLEELANNTGKQVGSLTKVHRAQSVNRNWTQAVFILRHNVFVSWRQIQLGLKNKLGIKVEISPVVADSNRVVQ